MVETINKIVRTQRQLSQELGREPTVEEIAGTDAIPGRTGARATADKSGHHLA